MKYRLFDNRRWNLLLQLVFLLFIGCNRKDFLNPNDPINFPPAPAVVYPMGNMVIYDNPPTFYWFFADSLSVVCEVQGAYNSNFANPVFSEVVGPSQDTVHYYRPDGLLKEHCFWRVRAKREGASDSAWGKWSSTGSFIERFPLVGECISGGYNIIIRDDYAYIIKDNTFHILDVSNPTEPEFLTSFSDSAVDWFYDMEKEGNYLYFTGYYPYSLRIYSNPCSPQFAGVCSLDHSPEALAISYPAVYVGRSSDVAVVDVSDPAKPEIVGAIYEDIYDLAVKGNCLILFTSSKIKVYDITDPFHPSIANSYSYSAHDFCISGDTLFTSRYNEIIIFDISALPVIEEVSSFSTDYGIYQMCSSNNCLVAYGSTIGVFEFSGVAEPEEGRLYPSFSTSGISANKGYLYLISSYEGMRVVRLCK